MRIKDGKGKITERIFLISASVLTIALLVYVVWLVRHMVQKSEAVFSIENSTASNVPTFNFAKYEKLFGPISTSTASSTEK